MDKSEFFRRLIEETRIALKLPALKPDALEGIVKDLIAGRDADRIWQTAEQIGPQAYLQHHRTVAGAVLSAPAATGSWLERLERSVKSTSHTLRNPFVLGATILGVTVSFKLLSRALDSHHHAKSAAIEKDVVRAIEATALSGNVPFLTLASMGDKLIDAAAGGEPHASHHTAHHHPTGRTPSGSHAPHHAQHPHHAEHRHASHTDRIRSSEKGEDERSR